MKSRRLIYIKHVTHGGQAGQVHTGFWWGNLKQRNHLEVTGIDGRIILKWILKEEDGKVYL